MIECEHGDDPAICPPCQGAALARDPVPGEWGPPFLAQYPGTCGGCEFEILPGDRIRGRDRGEAREYRHPDCAT